MQDCIDADVIKLGKDTLFCNPLHSGQKGLIQIGISFHSASKEIGKKVSNRVMIPVFIAGHDGLIVFIDQKERGYSVLFPNDLAEQPDGICEQDGQGSRIPEDIDHCTEVLGQQTGLIQFFHISYIPDKSAFL